ncbi:MAG TPA: hypothetical protein QF753_07895 [Victivallales bacterium]|nr:hypothetical protein [Victivallales bacterium]
MKQKKLLLLMISFFCVILLLSSCKILDSLSGFDSKELPLWTISVNEIVKYPRATVGEKEVPSYNPKEIEKVWIRRHYEFNSRSVEKITPVAIKGKEGYFNLKVKLDRQGTLVGMRLCNDTSHPPWALLVDGVYYQSVTFAKANKSDDYSEIIIKGSFDKKLSELLEKYAEPNYEHFHPKI